MPSPDSIGQHPRQFEATVALDVACPYLLYLPGDYGRDEQRWPLILFLHGAGERGNNLELVKKHGLPRIIQNRTDFPFIVVSPQCPRGRWWDNRVLIALLDEIMARYAVDPERVYLTGLSMGGFGTWSLAIEHPDRFAAIAPVCGGGIPYLLDRIRHLPVWAFHGARDNVVPLFESKRMVDVLERMGGQARLTVYPEATHDSWTATYNNPKLYDWFLEHRRPGPSTNQQAP
ncbi:MAG: prolyl oligopeptidase family serine peptidase [Phycisphaerales bacterium]|nr:prolyl oligopeptidase family serine peptidase [Phycisphaerales bacterium]